jgi:hypothetical protein
MTGPNRPPLPAGVSDAARAYLAHTVPFGDAAPPDDLDEVDGWLRYVEARNAMLAQRFAGIDVSDAVRYS